MSSSKKPPLTHAKLKELVHYNPETGAFTRIKIDGTRDPAAWAHIVGQPMGQLHPHGYLKAHVWDKKYSLHRLAWFYMTGSWPKEIDHKNRIKTDNRWINLREASQLENIGNCSPVHCQRASFSGVRGVYRVVHNNGWHGKWTAHIASKGPNGKRKILRLGTFDTIEEAKAAREKAAKERYGEFYNGWEIARTEVG